MKEIQKIVVDQEYPGNEALIKGFLLQEIRKTRPDFDSDIIMFGQIGKKSKAHFLAYGIAIGKKRANQEVTAKEILKMVIK